MKDELHLILRTVILSLCIAITIFGDAQNKSVKDTILLKEAVITGTPVKVNKNDVPMSVTVITREQIDESDEISLLPILNGRVPGLFVTERGVTGFGVGQTGAGQITMRGLGGDPTTEVLMLIDGHPQFMGIYGHPLSDTYISSDVERVEVIRGPASILYGTNAMGGVINIITRKQTEDGVHGDAQIMYGSFNTQKYIADIGFKKDNFSVFASINHDQSDGQRTNSNFDITDGYLKLGYDINKNLKINTDFSIDKFKAEDPGPDTLNAIYGAIQNITRGYWALTLDNDYDKFSGTAKVFYNFGKHDFTDGFHSTDANYGLNLSESAKLFKSNSITIGADYTDYGGIARQDTGEGKSMKIVDTTVYEFGVYGFVQQTFFNRLTLNAGIRLEDNQVYGKQWVPAGGFAFNINPTTTWKASVSKGFRSPTIYEMFMNQYPFPKLNPETVIDYETGILKTFFNNKLYVELTGFIMKGNNLIEYGYMGDLFNSGKIDNKGIEFAANASPVTQPFIQCYLLLHKYDNSCLCHS